MPSLIAKSFLDPKGSVVASGQRLAEGVIKSLRETSGPVVIDLHDMPPVASSYFNVVFLAVAQALGADAIGRLHWQAPLPMIDKLIQRSRDAALARVAALR